MPGNEALAESRNLVTGWLPFVGHYQGTALSPSKVPFCLKQNRGA